MAKSGCEILVFEVAGRQLALLAADVREVVRAVAITPVPRASQCVEGLINLRGRYVPVLDPRARLGLPAKPLHHADHLVVAQVDQRMVALRVDRALDLVRVSESDIDDTPNILPGMEDVRCVARLPDASILVYDARALLRWAESAAIDDGWGAAGSLVSPATEPMVP